MTGPSISYYRTLDQLGGAMVVVSKVKDTSCGRFVVLNFHPKERF